MKSILLYILGIVIIIGMLAYGIKIKEFIEVERNATLLCLSCIGIG